MMDQCSRRRLYPSDRELTLRSKINLGWSVHSHRVYRHQRRLSDSEWECILGVISRAQAIDLFEQQRIGRLVERLENVKQNTLENGPKSCSMCGGVFGMRSSVFKCSDCAKSVCNKCYVDTHSVAHDPCMLCKICAEDRELWKKSGGWFYGSLPTYAKLTRKVSVSPSMGRTTWEHRNREIVRLESFEPAENENRAFSLKSSWASLPIQKEVSAGDSDLDSNDEVDSSSQFNDSSSGLFLKPMDDNLRREASLQYLAAPEMNSNLLHMSSMSTSCPSLVPRQMKKIISSHQSIGTLEFSLAYNSKSNVLECTIHCVKGLTTKIKDDEMTYVRVYTIPFSKKMNTMRSKSVGKDTTIEFNETLVFSKIRQEKLKKRVLRLQVLDEDPFDEKIIGEVGVDLSDLKSVKSNIFTLPLKESHSEIQNVANSGWILLSLRYSPEDHSLVLGIICCADLVASNKNGQLDSFVRVKLLPELSDNKYESAVKNKTLNPTFNEHFTFHLSPFEMKSKSLTVSVLEKTGKHSKCIGYVTLGIQARGEMLQHWLEALQKPKIAGVKWHALLRETKCFV